MAPWDNIELLLEPLFQITFQTNSVKQMDSSINSKEKKVFISLKRLRITDAGINTHRTILLQLLNHQLRCPLCFQSILPELLLQILAGK